MAIDRILESAYQANLYIRWFRLFWVGLACYGFYRHRTRPTKQSGGYPPADATIICPTVQPKRALIDALRSWLANHPREIMVVSTIPWLPSVRELVQQVNDARITIHTIDGRGKRPALVKGIQRAETSVVALVDDNIIWSPDTLHGLLNALAESRDVGGVTPIKNNKNPEMTALGAIAATRLDRRSMANAAMAYFVNGQVIVYSGKTSAYRMEILQDPNFLEYFTRDMWMNKYPLVSGDDVAITYWLYRNGWRTGFISQDEYAIIAQQVPGTFRIHLGQVLRWAKNRIRQILRDMATIVSGSSPLWYRALSVRSIVFPAMVEDYFLIPDFLTILLVLVARAAGVLSQTTTVIPSSWTIVLHYLGFNGLLELTSSLWHFYRCP